MISDLRDDASNTFRRGGVLSTASYQAPNGDEYETTFEESYEGHYGDFQWHTTDET